MSNPPLNPLPDFVGFDRIALMQLLYATLY